MTMIGTSPGIKRRQHLDRLLLFGLLIFTLVSLVGYWTFALHPQNLTKYPGALSFYSVSFKFFAQLQVGLSFAVLAIYLSRKLGTRWLGAFTLVYGISFLSEFVGTTFGVPFGPYSYSDLLGIKWFSRVPILIPISWFTMTIPSFVIARAIFPKHVIRRVLFAAVLLTLWDLSLDPAMSYLTTYWIWGDTGAYYGMPWINLLGWYVTSIVLMSFLVSFGAEKWSRQLPVNWMSAYYGVVLLMPFGMNLAAGLSSAVLATVAAVGVAALVAHLASPAKTKGEPKNTNVREPDRGHEGAEVSQNAGNTWSYFRHHSKSFSAASTLFPKAARSRVALAYAYCRYSDDLVDEAVGSPSETLADLDRWQDRSRQAYGGESSGIDWLDHAMQDARQSGLPFSAIEDLLAGMRSDVEDVAIRDLAELDTYCYRVAGVVGLWMSCLFDVRDPWMVDRAVALGKAMQLTNILRDVGEDLHLGRRYLPFSIMRKNGVSNIDLENMAQGEPLSDGYRNLIGELIERADKLYDFAWEAIPALPPGFRRAVVVAATLYQGIHSDLVRNDKNNLTYRSYTSFLSKIGLAAKGWLRLRRSLHRISVSKSERAAFITLAADSQQEDLHR